MTRTREEEQEFIERTERDALIDMIYLANHDQDACWRVMNETISYLKLKVRNDIDRELAGIREDIRRVIKGEKLDDDPKN